MPPKKDSKKTKPPLEEAPKPFTLTLVFTRPLDAEDHLLMNKFHAPYAYGTYKREIVYTGPHIKYVFQFPHFDVFRVSELIKPLLDDENVKAKIKGVNVPF